MTWDNGKIFTRYTTLNCFTMQFWMDLCLANVIKYLASCTTLLNFPHFLWYCNTPDWLDKKDQSLITSMSFPHIWSISLIDYGDSYFNKTPVVFGQQVPGPNGLILTPHVEFCLQGQWPNGLIITPLLYVCLSGPGPDELPRGEGQLCVSNDFLPSHRSTTALHSRIHGL